MQFAVECRAVQKEFGSGDTRMRALRGVDWQVPFGGLTVLSGPSGCGKTTLLSVITGVLAASAGEIEVLGERFHAMRGSRLVRFRRQNLGFIFQQFNLLPALTATENAALPLMIAGQSRKSSLERATEWLERLRLCDRRNAYPSELSGGQQQRVAIARALIHDPRLVVCDEPTSALDASTGYRVMEFLAAHAVRPGRATIVVTHDERVLPFASHVARMEDGALLTQREEQ